MDELFSMDELILMDELTKKCEKFCGDLARSNILEATVFMACKLGCHRGVDMTIKASQKVLCNKDKGLK